MTGRRRAAYLSQVAPEAAPAQFLEAVLEDTANLADKGEVEGLALPYNEVLNRPHYSGASRQKFAPGSAKVRPSAQLYYGHDHQLGGMPIGRVLTAKDTDKGLRLRVRFAKTAKADEVKTLATPDEDGVAVLDRYSIGYFEVAGHLEDDGDLWVHDEVDVFEDSIVPLPAYNSAVIDTVLSHRPNLTQKETPMTPEQRARLVALRALTTLSAAEAGELSTLAALDAANPAAPPAPPAEGLASAADVSALSASVEDLTRQIATLGAGGSVEDAPPAVPGRSFGEFLSMIATPTHPQHADAVAFLAYVGGTVADLGPLMKDTWVGDRYRIVQAQRDLINFFSSSPLPASGMGVEYGVVGTDTTQVAEQVNEGDTLAYGKITFDIERTGLKTFGGWGEMSFQQIQRSPIAVIERYFDALLRRYAQTTEAWVNALTLASGTPVAMGDLFAGGALTGSDAWTAFVIRSARVMKRAGYPIDGLLVGFDVFEAMARMPDEMTENGARPFLDRDTGSVNIVGLRGNVYTLPVIPFETGATANVVRAASKEAIRTYEAAGAPFRLQDDDITKLTHAASVYGYMAAAVEVPGVILKPAAA